MTMKKNKRKIRVDPDTTVSSVWLTPEDWTGDVIVVAHGAGNDMDSAFMCWIHEALAGLGLCSVKFNFPYKELGRKAPDRRPRLVATWRAVLKQARKKAGEHDGALYAAGKSMGGRMASLVAAEGEQLDGLIFFGYPLHPPNKPDKLRSEHLPEITCPMLFIQGTRDALCGLDTLKNILKPLKKRTTLHVVEGGDHSFKVLKRLGRSEEDVQDEIVQAVANWL
jgi:predicted alpha/beta-hydrolase family hydrolase